MQVLGLDIGGTGIKGAPVDTESGSLLAERKSIETPQPSTPDAVLAVVREIVDHFDWRGPIGCGFPSVVQRGVVRTASHIHQSWYGLDICKMMSDAFDREVRVINDADAAGLAEMKFGAGRGRGGVVLTLTLGTGVGTALFCNGRLVPNLELGQIIVDGLRGEQLAAASVRARNGLSWKDWADRLDSFLDTIVTMLWPDLIIIGGGISAEAERFLPKLSVSSEVVAARFEGEAGLVGAALVETAFGRYQTLSEAGK